MGLLRTNSADVFGMFRWLDELHSQLQTESSSLISCAETIAKTGCKRFMNLMNHIETDKS